MGFHGNFAQCSNFLICEVEEQFLRGLWEIYPSMQIFFFFAFPDQFMRWWGPSSLWVFFLIMDH